MLYQLRKPLQQIVLNWTENCSKTAWNENKWKIFRKPRKLWIKPLSKIREKLSACKTYREITEDETFPHLSGSSSKADVFKHNRSCRSSLLTATQPTGLHLAERQVQLQRQRVKKRSLLLWRECGPVNQHSQLHLPFQSGRKGVLRANVPQVRQAPRQRSWITIFYHSKVGISRKRMRGVNMVQDGSCGYAVMTPNGKPRHPHKDISSRFFSTFYASAATTPAFLSSTQHTLPEQVPYK